ncbi:Rap1a/Tai family immunity protein (plasmid) [Methylobacterium phyllosphaerae]
MSSRIANRAVRRGRHQAQQGSSRALGTLEWSTALRLFASVLIVGMALVCPAHSSPIGEAAEDIIGGCNQIIKLARKGRSHQDPDSMREQGECLGAVRTMLATEIAADEICPTENVKLIDAVTAFSLYLIQNPTDLKVVYVVPLRRALRAAYPCSAIRQ